VERPVDHDLAEQAVEQRAGQRGALLGGQVSAGRGQRAAVEVLHDEHRFAAQRRVRNRNLDAAPVRRRGGHRRHVARLYPQVEFLAQRVGEPLRQLYGADRPAPARAALQPGRQPGHDVQVPVQDPGHVRPAHLDDHPGAGPERRGVNLGDGGRGQRLAAGRQRAQEGQGQADQPAHPEREDEHGQGGRDRHQGHAEGRHGRLRSARAGRDLGMARLPCGLDEGVRGLVRTRI
jgi:hypothetical protein